jgi:hypothetical protein
MKIAGTETEVVSVAVLPIEAAESAKAVIGCTGLRTTLARCSR